MAVFGRLREILNRPVSVRSREFPVWQIALASTVAVVGAISLIRRFTRPRYGFYTTAEQVIAASNRGCLRNQTIVVTGANRGLGKLTTQHLVSEGATVIMGCRKESDANSAIEDIVKALSSQDSEEIRRRLQFISLDLNCFKSIKQFAETFGRTHSSLDQLINNAGVMAVPTYKTTKQGHEWQFGVNHIGHSYLTRLLTPYLRDSTGTPRVICLSSSAHNGTDLNEAFGNNLTEENIKNWNGPTEEGYEPFKNYSWSKTANMLFAYEYNQRNNVNQDRETKVAAVSLHPGGIMTDLGRHLSTGTYIFFLILSPLFIKSLSQGISTTLRCATLSSRELDQYSGEYFADCNPSSVNKNPRFKYIGSRFLKPDHNPNINPQFAEIARKFYDWTQDAIDRAVKQTEQSE